jgi:alpha-ketoglutarate-dependent taurine dioxygenase
LVYRRLMRAEREVGVTAIGDLSNRISELSPERRAVLERRLMKRDGTAPGEPTIPRRRPEDPRLLSFNQQRLWFLDQLSPDTPTYNVPTAARIGGPLDVEALRRALDAIVDRHEVLRTTFDCVDGSPVPVLREGWPTVLRTVDLRGWPDATREAEAQRLLTREAGRPFDLSRDLMLRATLLRLREREFILLIVTHHIAWDLRSKALLYQELAALYEAFRAGRRAPLPELPIQYADFALWQRRCLRDGAALERLTSYWKRRLAGAPPRLEVPADHPRPPIQSLRGAKSFFALPAALVDGAKALGRQAGCTLYMTLLAAFKAFLGAYTGQQDICVGSPIAGRDRVETEALIGFFINTLVLRTDLSGNPTFRELLGRVREVTLGAYAHQEMPFEKLVEIQRPPRDLSRMALFQVNFRVASAPPPPLGLTGLTVTPLELIDNATSKFDLALELATTEGSSSYFEYSTDLFREATIGRMRDDFERVLDAVLAHPDTPLNDLDPFIAIATRRRTMEQTKDAGRAQPQIKGLREIRRKAVDLSRASLVRIDGLEPGQTFPLVIRPALDDVVLADWARDHREFIEAHLLKHGAILFRGFHLPSVTDFEAVATAVSGALFGEYGDLPREGASGRIYASTPYPPDQAILFHNESAHLQRWPMKISFFCVRAAQQGGETPILDCREVCRRLDPAVFERFRREGLMYVRNFSEGIDVRWQDFFHTTDRAAVERICREDGVECEWTAGGNLRVRQVCRAVARHPKTGETVFFNQVQLHHISCLDPAVRQSLRSLFREEDLPRNVYYGDGSPIEDAVMEHIAEVYWKAAVSAPWQEGDIIMLDNMLTAHARLPYVGPRKIVVAMAEMISGKDVPS